MITTKPWVLKIIPFIDFFGEFIELFTTEFSILLTELAVVH